MNGRVLRAALRGASLSALVALCGCTVAVTGPGGPGQIYAATPVVRSARFCKQEPPPPPGVVAYCEDFATLAEGHLPAWWLGGDGLAVRRLPRRTALAPFEPRERYNLTIPDWNFDGDFRIELLVTGAPFEGGFGVVAGPVNYAFAYDGHNYVWKARIGSTATPVQGFKVHGRGQPIFLAFTREGPVYRVFVNTRPVALIRHAYEGPVNGLALEASGKGFTIAGIRVRGAAVRPRAAPTVPAKESGAGLTAPELVSPPDGAVFTLFPRTTRLVWQPVAGAASYEAEVQACDLDGSGCRVFFMLKSTTTSAVFNFVGSQPGLWRVRAISPSGAQGPFSAQWKFLYADRPPTVGAPAVAGIPADRLLKLPEAVQGLREGFVRGDAARLAKWVAFPLTYNAFTGEAERPRMREHRFKNANALARKAKDLTWDGIDEAGVMVKSATPGPKPGQIQVTVNSQSQYQTAWHLGWQGGVWRLVGAQ